MHARISSLFAVLATLNLTACSLSPAQHQGAHNWPQTNFGEIATANSAAACQQLLRRDDLPAFGALNPELIGMANWNIQKTEQPGWREDFALLASDSQLLLLQEAAYKPELMNTRHQAAFWSFAPGYQTKSTSTGVVTFSSAPPVIQCNLTSWEPWLRSPKATSITSYALDGSDQTLVVVNIHALNFTFGVAEYARQMERVQQALSHHAGPVILSGDFNSWRKAREAILDKLVTQMELTPVAYATDHRTQVFGRPIDHIYVRGLDTIDSQSSAVVSSDHNPMRARFALAD